MIYYYTKWPKNKDGSITLCLTFSLSNKNTRRPYYYNLPAIPYYNDNIIIYKSIVRNSSISFCLPRYTVDLDTMIHNSTGVQLFIYIDSLLYNIIIKHIYYILLFTL